MKPRANEKPPTGALPALEVFGGAGGLAVEHRFRRNDNDRPLASKREELLNQAAWFLDPEHAAHPVQKMLALVISSFERDRIGTLVEIGTHRLAGLLDRVEHEYLPAAEDLPPGVASLAVARVRAGAPAPRRPGPPAEVLPLRAREKPDKGENAPPAGPGRFAPPSAKVPS